jgi:phage/plasmid-like protein (TIGR03299 family)
MAHNLNETNGKISFASTQTAWHGLGQIVNEAMTSKQAIELAGLNYVVDKTDAVAEIQGKIATIQGKFATYRRDTGMPLGIVGARYEVVQNEDAFLFFDSITEAGCAMYETAGALGKNGERIFISAKMPDFITIAGTEDNTEVYILLTSSHDGSGSVVAAITPIRVVCQNTLNAALYGTTNKISIRHTSNVKQNLANAHKLLGITHKYTEQLNECFNFLAKKSVTDEQVKKLVADLFKSEKEDSSRIKNIQEAVFTSYNTGIGQSEIMGTAWGAYNGITHYLDHQRNYKDRQVKFENILFGKTAELTQKAFNELVKI